MVLNISLVLLASLVAETGFIAVLGFLFPCWVLASFCFSCLFFYWAGFSSVTFYVKLYWFVSRSIPTI